MAASCWFEKALFELNMNSKTKKLDCSVAFGLKPHWFWIPAMTAVNWRAPLTHMRHDRLMSQYMVLTKSDVPDAAAPFEVDTQPAAVSL